jgi:polar amino acid transport system ATP-binding protein
MGTEMEGGVRLNLENVCKTYGAQRALDGLSLSLPDDTRCLALIGPSGGGKSTLLRHLGGLEVPDSGLIEVNGKPLPRDENALRALRRKNGFLFQSYNLFPHRTALDNITLPLIHVHGQSEPSARALAEEQLARFGLGEHSQKFPAQLSGGQQQRVALIRAIVSKPSLLFLDEPTAALDPEMTGEVLALIRELIREGQEVVVCTHEMGFARAVADSVAFIADGKVLECAKPEALFDAPKHDKVRRFLSRVLAFR